MNLLATRKRKHSRKPDELYRLIENCSWGPYLELFARTRREKWTNWGNQAPEEVDSFAGPTFGRAYSETGNAIIEDLDAQQLRLMEQPPRSSSRARKSA